jgi:hypothetical protein
MAGKTSDLLPISAQIKPQFQFTFSPVLPMIDSWRARTAPSCATWSASIAEPLRKRGNG